MLPRKIVILNNTLRYYLVNFILMVAFSNLMPQNSKLPLRLKPSEKGSLRNFVPSNKDCLVHLDHE